MIKQTPPPKVSRPRLLFIAYAYAAALIVAASVQLVGMGGLSFGNFTYETPGAPEWIVLISLLQIFALPFVLRLPLSPLTRFLSASFALLAPLLVFTHVTLIDTVLHTAGTPDILLAMAFALLGMASFWLLNGAQALRLSHK